MTAVCIAGMHRSGTSLVARLLNLCGLYLGKDEELMPPTQDNVDGYWENLLFFEINESLLAQLNGSWNLPPSQDSALEMQKQPRLLIERAQALVQSFEIQKIWGWKDPRNSLTLPFWQTLIPNLKIINCVRNPLEVVQSLAKRDHFSRIFSFELWNTYYERLLSVAPPENLITTHYSVYFSNPQDELERLLRFIGIVADRKTIDTACSATKLSLKHNRSNLEYLIAEGAPLKVLDRYAQLCSQAGPVYWDAIKVKDPSSLSNSKILESDIDNSLLHSLIEKDPVVLSLAAHIATKERAAESLSTQLAEKEQALIALTTQLREKEQAMKVLSSQIAESEDEAISLMLSKSWQFTRPLRKVYRKLNQAFR